MPALHARKPMSYQIHTHCSYCGQPFAAEQPWPRQCAHCQQTTFRNPLPVAVLLIPVDGGVLVVRRGIEPRRGWLALPGGYIETGETWQAAAAREAYEEAGIVIDPAAVRTFDVVSPSANLLVVVGMTPPLRSADLPPFTPTAEADERTVLHMPEELAFPLHTQILTRFLQR
jgi:ADP-ribose pyrophosphatase YjhB (NUDIX family)